LDAIGSCHQYLDQWPDAEESYRESIRRWRELGESGNELEALSLLLSAPPEHPLADAEALRARAEELRAKLHPS